MKKRFRGFREEVGQAFGPKVLKVLRFDSGFAAEGCGIAAKGGDEYIVSATEFTLCLQCSMTESKSPLPQEGGVAVKRRRNSVSSLLIFSVFLRASLSSIPVGQTKGRPFYGQAKGQLCPTWQSYAGLPPEEGALRYGMFFFVTNAT